MIGKMKMPINLFIKKRDSGRAVAKPMTATKPGDEKRFQPAEQTKIPAGIIDQCLSLGRFGYLLQNPQRFKLEPDFERACRTAADQIDDLFAMVPEGFASLPKSVNDFPGCPEETVDTKEFLIARTPVTNAQYQRFVDSGGYDDLELWPKEIWPHLIDFKDQTEQPSPRYWRNGRHCKTQSNHPVVGINFYEAGAYANWAGYRLPNEAEWQMASTWRIRSSANTMRRYPWGDSLDTLRCNIWASGVGTTCPVENYPDGAAPNGVLQLVGNVWEWTCNEFVIADDEGNRVVSDMRMSSIRGGAFDTYFAVQATGTFRTGLLSMARTHNVGFRCALDIDKAGAS